VIRFIRLGFVPMVRGNVGLAAAIAAISLATGVADGFTPSPATQVDTTQCGVGYPLAPGHRFTLVFRVQVPYDVERLAAIHSRNPQRLPVEERDVFMVRARGEHADEAPLMVSRLKDPTLLSGQEFRCNRISALTGDRADQAIPQEYAGNLADDARVWSVGPDWERFVYQLGYPDTPGDDAIDPEPEWSSDFDTNVERLGVLAQDIHNHGKLIGPAIAGPLGRWDYGQLALQAGLDHQLVQTQQACVTGTDAFTARARRLIQQYRDARLRISNLAMEVSFSEDPAATSIPGDVTPQQAADCVSAAYAAGARGFLLWAQPAILPKFFAALPDSIRG
jgi:hypothetical protein